MRKHEVKLKADVDFIDLILDELAVVWINSPRHAKQSSVATCGFPGVPATIYRMVP